MLLKILIVDDIRSITEMLSDRLGLEDDYEIDVANTGFQAMDKLLSFNPDLVILDLSLPGMSGKEVLIKIKEVKPNTKVIIASVHDDDQTKKFCFKHGATHYITKPYEAVDVSNHVKNLLSEM